jgi:outer membrane protein, heavy metal efflux system
MRHYKYLLCAGFMAFASLAHAEPTTNSLSLDDSIRQVLAYSPALKAKMESIGGSRGERQQSGLIPNPEISFEAENILGNGSANGVSGAEVTVGVAQLVELGGKRGARLSAANRLVDLTNLEYAAAGLDLVRDASVSWAEAVASAEELRLAQDQKELADEVLSSVSRRVAAAAENVIQKSKAEVALAASKIELAKAQRNKMASIKALAGLWGEDTPAFNLDTAGFFVIEQPDFTGDHATLGNNPDLKLIEAGVGLARANLDIERANAVPDVTFEAGVRDNRDAEEQSFLAGVSIPFPAFNRNQGTILKAGHDVTKSEHEKAATINALDLSLVKAQNALEISYAEITSLEKDILPSAEKAFSQARKGYQAGKFPYLEVLDAQRTLFEVRAQHVAALKDYHTAKAELDRLTGKHLNLIQFGGEQK